MWPFYPGCLGELVDEWREALDIDKLVGSVFLDLSSDVNRSFHSKNLFGSAAIL